MNEAHTNAVLAALEGQRNNALNGLVNTEAALTVARARITELEKQVKELLDASKVEQRATLERSV